MSFATEEAQKEKAEVRARLLAAIKPDEPNPYPRPAADQAAQDALWMADYADALERLLRPLIGIVQGPEFYGEVVDEGFGTITDADFYALGKIAAAAKATLGEK